MAEVKADLKPSCCELMDNDIIFLGQTSIGIFYRCKHCKTIWVNELNKHTKLKVWTYIKP